MALYHYILIHVFNPTTLLGALFYGAIVVIAAWLVGRTFGVGVHRYLDRADAAGMDSTSLRFLGQLVKVAVYVIAFLIYANLIPALQSLGTAWLASIGVVSLVIGLATQTTLSNLVSGIALILYRPFRVGDRIQVTTPAGPEIGVVESIDLGYTSLCTPEGRRIVLPNSAISTQTHINFSRNNSHVLVEVSLTAAQGTNIDDMSKILLDVGETIKKITKINGCFVTGLTAQGTVIMFSGICQNPGDIAQIKSDLLEGVQKRFAEAGIKLA